MALSGTLIASAAAKKPETVRAIIRMALNSRHASMCSKITYDGRISAAASRALRLTRRLQRRSLISMGIKSADLGGSSTALA